MSGTPRNKRALLWTCLGALIFVYGIYAVFTTGGITAWLMILAGGLNAVVFGKQLLSKGDE